MAILYSRNSFYDPQTGTVFVLKDNELQPQTIRYSDTEHEMLTKQFPTVVQPTYVSVLKDRLEKVLRSFTALGKFKIDLQLVPNDPAFGPFGFVFTTNPESPTINFSVAMLSYEFNSDPISLRNFRRYIITQLSVNGYVVE